MRSVAGILLLGVAMVAVACTQESPTSAIPTGGGTVPAATPTTAALVSGPDLQPGHVLLEVAEGTEARYRVTEQLARLNFPSDAVGATRQVEGVIVLDESNAVVVGESRLTVDLRTLASDESRRDSFIRQNTIVTFLYPLAEYVPSKVVGLPTPLPTNGTATFQVSGDMTIHGVTKSLTLDVNATFGDQEITGRAATNFSFGDFGITIPKVASILSVEDDIRLEVDFKLRRSGAGL